jgi:hypothetical protein
MGILDINFSFVNRSFTVFALLVFALAGRSMEAQDSTVIRAKLWRLKGKKSDFHLRTRSRFLGFSMTL